MGKNCMNDDSKEYESRERAYKRLVKEAKEYEAEKKKKKAQKPRK